MKSILTADGRKKRLLCYVQAQSGGMRGVYREVRYDLNELLFNRTAELNKIMAFLI